MLIAAKNLAEVQKTPDNLQIKLVENNLGYFLCTDNQKHETEKDINEFIKSFSISKSLSMVSFRSKHSVILDGEQPLNIYLVSTQNYENPNLINTDNIYLCSNQDFIQKRDRRVLVRY